MKRNGRKRRKRRGYGGVILKLLSFFIICFAVLTATTVFFKIERIKVTGESPYSAEEIVAASGIEIGENTFFVNKFAAISKIFSKLPYLDEITMRRHLPSELEIIVTQCEAIASVAGEGGVFLMDIKGKILEQIDAERGADYIVIEGSEPQTLEIGKQIDFLQKEKEKTLTNVLNELKNYDIIKQIKSISVEKLYSLRFTYGERFIVELGSGQDLSAKIKLVLAVEQQLSPSERGIIDVSSLENIRFRPQ